MATRKELTEAVAQRYREASKGDKSKILNEFEALTSYHRKHAIRVLCGVPHEPGQRPGRNRLYDEAVRRALIVLWEASDRLCGKRLKALIPMLVDVDMVEHCGGPKTDGNFVHTLVLTDIASGWTECVAMPLRNQLLIVEGMTKFAAELAFPMLGVDTDNDSAFMNQTVFDHCQALAIEQTRSRAYKKNDEAWVEQKNGSIVRRLVGYGRLSGRSATDALARLYAVSRLYINFFQPSFKLKSKTRDGARVRKTYHPPMTPCDRLLCLPNVADGIKAKLREQLDELDPVRLLQEIRTAQHTLAELSASGKVDCKARPPVADISTFLSSLSRAWQDGEVRPTHRKQPGAKHWWRTRTDPFEHTWPLVNQWLESESTITAKDIMERLAELVPDVYASGAQLRTLQRRVKQWRAEKAKTLILGQLQRSSDHTEHAALTELSPALQGETTT